MKGAAQNMEAVAKVTHVRIAPRKVRVVIDLIRNKKKKSNKFIVKRRNSK